MRTTMTIFYVDTEIHVWLENKYKTVTSLDFEMEEPIEIQVDPDYSEQARDLLSTLLNSHYVQTWFNQNTISFFKGSKFHLNRLFFYPSLVEGMDLTDITDQYNVEVWVDKGPFEKIKIDDFWERVTTLTMDSLSITDAPTVASIPNLLTLDLERGILGKSDGIVFETVTTLINGLNFEPSFKCFPNLINYKTKREPHLIIFQLLAKHCKRIEKIEIDYFYYSIPVLNRFEQLCTKAAKDFCPNATFVFNGKVCYRPRSTTLTGILSVEPKVR
jgi:hypothetical protein